MNKKNVLVTGGAGFIGANFIPTFLNAHPDYSVVNLDKLTYAGDLANLSEVNSHPRYAFEQADICSESQVKSILEKHKITDIIHFAAESHVDNSISGPKVFYETNVMGTYNLLWQAKSYWKDLKSSRFHHVSTDEVYGALGDTGYFTETTPYAPNSPYSSSKASSDFVVRAFTKTYGMNTTISNCSNNFGPKQHKEKLIPVIIKKAISGENIPIYGEGKNVRDWLYVIDHCEAIDVIFHKGKSGETYNVGTENEINNLELCHHICKILDTIKPGKKSYKEQITFVKDRPGHDFRYAIDSSKLEKELGWKAKADFQTQLTKTIEWYLKSLG
jgi:dTDP-glucose 4,6-dehydratase